MTAGLADLIETNAVLAAAGGEFVEPEAVADAVVTAMAGGQFLILPHPFVAEEERRLAADRDQWLGEWHRNWRLLQQST
jgi:hypothetical protein